MADLDTVATSLVEDKAYLSCPHCTKPYQILNPKEGLVYQCQQCQSHFLLRKETGRYQPYMWSEDQILKILFDMQGLLPTTKLAQAWRTVMDDLENMEAHSAFINCCRQKNSMSVAREKYKQLALYLNWENLSEPLKNIIDPSRVKPSPWMERLPWALLGLASVLILTGTFFPHHRNMIGAGVIVAVVTFLFYRKRIMSRF